MNLVNFVVLLGLLAISVPNAKADTPASCLPSTISADGGAWTLTTGKLRPSYFDCSTLEQLEAPFGQIAVTLAADNTVSVAGSVAGAYTSIYDEGFEATFTDHTMKLGFFESRAFAYADWEQNGQTVVSRCGQTRVGWVVDAKNPTGQKRCYVAKKTTTVSHDETRTVPETEGGNFVYTQEVADAHVEYLRATSSGTWTPAVQQQFIGMTMHEISRLMGATSVPKPTRGLIHPSTPQRAADAPAAPVRGAGLDLDAGVAVPAEFNWVDVNGETFVPAVRSQAQCGSCYAFSSTGSAMARVRVASNNKDQRTASPQQIVSCATNLSQGCDGGWPYLTAGKYMNEGLGLVSESCYPYNAPTAAGNATMCRSGPLACPGEAPITVSEYGYVGGAFGLATEELMIKDILKYGPLSISFEVTPDFMTYTGGVYVPPSNATTASPIPEFVVTNHVVVIVGYGVDEESNLPYWLVQNSWGNDYGVKACNTVGNSGCEKGYFKILRGANALGIEEMPVTFTVNTV